MSDLKKLWRATKGIRRTIWQAVLVVARQKIDKQLPDAPPPAPEPEPPAQP